MKEVLRTLVRKAVAQAVEQGAIDLPDLDSLRIEVSRTKDAKFGDYATNAALVTAGPARRKPRELAEIIIEYLGSQPDLIHRAEVAGPGFVNFFLAEPVWHEAIRAIHSQKEAYGGHSFTDQQRQSVLLEFVSANPTGPLHVGHGRGAAVGDTLARLLRACGYLVKTEYYVNDAGNQMRILGDSVLLRYVEKLKELDGIPQGSFVSGEMQELLSKGEEFPSNYYQGDYIKDLAAALIGTRLGMRILTEDRNKATDSCAEYACQSILDGIKEDLGHFGVRYDNYFSEKKLHDSGAISACLQVLALKGRLKWKEGAIHFMMEENEDQKHRVIRRSTGQFTYFASDIAYHKDKFLRGHDRLIDIWGSDHHGYVPRVKAAIEALGHPAEALQVLLVQFVTLVRGGEKISMSTRSGEFITLKEVLDEVGSDAARFMFLTKRSDSHLEFDLDLAKRQSRDNPVYYVQYAHARVASIFRIAAERNIDADMTDPDLTLLTLPEEQRIIKHLADFPDMLFEAAEALEPHRLTFYLMELAEMFHAYYHDNKVLTEDEGLKKARLYLVEAVRQVVANGLGILGVSAPERM